jgi:hypothetical protein
MAIFALYRQLHENIDVMPTGCSALATFASVAGMSGSRTDRDGKKTNLSSLRLEAGNVCMPAYQILRKQRTYVGNSCPLFSFLSCCRD